MESVDFLAMCTCIYSTSRERKRLFGCCFHPRPGFRVEKISQCACAFLDESLAWVLRKSLFYECTPSACNSPLLKPFYGGLQGRFPGFAPISSHSPHKSSNIRAIYHLCHHLVIWLNVRRNLPQSSNFWLELRSSQNLRGSSRSGSQRCQRTNGNLYRVFSIGK